MTSASYWGGGAFYFVFKMYLFIWLHQVFVAAGRIFSLSLSLSLLVVACIGKDPDAGKD